MRRLLVLTVFLLTLAIMVLPMVLGRLFGRPAVQPPGIVEGEPLVVKVYFPETRQIQSLPLPDYLKGVVAAEMPQEFEMEALKAQMVVARTYTVRRMQHFTGPGRGGCILNPAADVCADHNTSQAYISRDQFARDKGEAATSALWKRLDLAEQQTQGLVLRYQGELVDPLYHSVSGRMTEDAGEYFSHQSPYLKPVSDIWGAYAPKLVESQRFKADGLARVLGVKEKPLVQVLAKTATGRVKTVKVGEKTFSGREFRERLDLRSADFTVASHNGDIVVTTHGYGHGVGMSQYGANGMAKQGKTYRDILTHYYTGVQISRIYDD